MLRETRRREGDRVAQERRRQEEEHPRMVQRRNETLAKKGDRERNQLRTRLESLKLQCREHNDGVGVPGGVLQECGPSWLRGPIGSRLQQGFRSWVQELKDGSGELGRTSR